MIKELSIKVVLNQLPASPDADTIYFVYLVAKEIMLQFITTSAGAPIPVRHTEIDFEIYTAATGANGAWSIDVSADFSLVKYARATALFTTTDLRELKIETHHKRTGTGETTIAGNILESDTNGILLGGSVEGLEFSESGRDIEIIVFGIKA